MNDDAQAVDHRQYLAAMSASTRQRLQQKNNRSGVVRLVWHAGSIVVFAWLIAIEVPGWPLLLPPQAVLLAFLFNLQHECTHKTPFRTAWLNEWVGHLAGFVIVQPFLWFRYFHYAHHRHTNDPRRDPELIGFAKPSNWLEYAVFVSAIKYAAAKPVQLWRNAFGELNDSYVPSAARARVRLEARVMLALYPALALAAFPWLSVLWWVWLLPLLLGFPLLKMYHLAEHGLCPSVDDKFVNTRTVLTRRLVLLVTWNMPYHIEHHLLPSVPFHQLPNLHRLVARHLRQTSSGYAAFIRSYTRTLS